MTPKIMKTISGIAKTKDKIAELQARLKELEQQKIFLENEEIIALCRKEKLSEDDLVTYIMSKREMVNDAQSGLITPSSGAAIYAVNKEGGSNEE